MSGEDRNPEVEREGEGEGGEGVPALDPRYSLLTGETGALWISYARGWQVGAQKKFTSPYTEPQTRAFDQFWQWLEGKEGKER